MTRHVRGRPTYAIADMSRRAAELPGRARKWRWMPHSRYDLEGAAGSAAGRSLSKAGRELCQAMQQGTFRVHPHLARWRNDWVL